MSDHDSRQRSPLPPIDFEALARALLTQADTLVPMWLPGGARRGPEYVCGSLSGGAGDSCSVNLTDGKWADFAGDDRGKDLVSLYAAVNGLTMGKAAVQVARDNGLEDVARVTRESGDAPPRPPPPARPPPVPSKAESEGWTSITPVPSVAPNPTFRHYDRKAEAIVHTAEYRIGDDLYGYVVRFLTSTGGKDTLPYTYCVSARDGGAKWTWKQWQEPRPLYLPSHAKPGDRTVILIEGEKKGDALQLVLDATAPNIYAVASWPGGCKAWKKADWSWLAGCTVILWPDCDAKREPLTAAERKQYPDELARKVAEQAKPILPAQKQPGLSAMRGIGARLRDEHACTVQLLPIPEPGAVVDGWDCGDAIEVDGWDGAKVLAFFAQAYALPEDAAAAPARARAQGDAGHSGGAPPPDRPAGADRGDEPDGDAFQEHLDFMCGQLDCEAHELGVNRKLLIAALRKAPALRDCVGFNELTGAPSTRVAWPWRSEAGPLKDGDDLQLGDWLCVTYKLKPASRAALAEAIDTVADQRRFHPVRDWLRGLEHDGKPRLDKWLIHVLGMDPNTLPARRRRYLELVGRFLLMGLVARAEKPGCKFDYSPVLEGPGGIGKSTFVKALVGDEFFSDTHFDIGQGKEGYEQLEGLWGYELSELTALRKADSEQVKQFFSSQIDRFRGAYGRFVQPHPRQCVIFCSTNKKQYLYDLTGNRRFWPFWIDAVIKLDWLKKWRAQLFAEAHARYTAGERYAPTREEEDELFVPEQKARLVQTAVQSRLYDLLTREGAPGGEGKLSVELSQHTKFVTLDRLIQALGTDAGKSNSLLEGQVRGWLESMGWTHGREGSGQRRYGYKVPAVWPPKIEDEEEGATPAPEEDDRQAQADPYGDDDDAPF